MFSCRSRIRRSLILGAKPMRREKQAGEYRELLAEERPFEKRHENHLIALLSESGGETSGALPPPSGEVTVGYPFMEGMEFVTHFDSPGFLRSC
jgi:hypothetical protein